MLTASNWTQIPSKTAHKDSGNTGKLQLIILVVWESRTPTQLKKISDAIEKIEEYYYFAPEVYTDENNCLIQNKLSGAYSEFKSFIKSNKIPEYAREYKREYQFIRGLNYEFRYFRYKPEYVSGYEFFNNLHVKKIIKLLKMFLRNQEKGIFSKEFNGLKLEGKDIFNLKYFYDNIIGNKEKIL